MSNMLYKLFYKQYGVRRISGLLRPKPIKLLSLPRNSIFHYYSDIESNYPIDVNLGFLSLNSNRVVVDFTTEYLGESIGAFRKRPFIVRAATKDFFRTNKLYKYIPDSYKTQTNDRILVIENYSYMNEVYRYVNAPMATYYHWVNTYRTILSTIGNMTQDSSRNHFLYIDVPDDIPSLPILNLYMDRVSLQLLKLFNTGSSYVILELWKWLDNINRPKSIFSSIPEDKYPLVNFIFRNRDNEVLVNMGYLNSFIKGQINTTEFDNIQQYPNTMLKKFFLRFLIGFRVVESVKLTEVEEEADVTEDDIEPTKVKSLLFDHRKSAIEPDDLVNKQIEEDLEEFLDDIDIDEELKSLDEDLARHSTIYGTKLISKGLTIDKKGNVKDTIYVEEDKPELTKEELSKKFYVAKEPSIILDDIIETLANSESMRVSDYKKYKKLVENYKESVTVYGEGKVKDQVVYKAEDKKLSESRSKVEVPYTVLDTNMVNMSNNALYKDYKDKLYHKDIINSIYNIQKAGVIVKSHTMDIDSSVLGEYENHRIELVPIDGAPSTISFRLPVLNNDNSIVINGNKAILRNQRVDLPIRKISPTKVSLSSYYGKNFVELSRLKANSTVSYITKEMFKKYRNKELDDIIPGNVYDNYFEAPYIYNAISEHYKIFKKGDYTFDFDRSSLVEKIPDSTIKSIEKNGNRVCGYTIDNKTIYITKNNIFHVIDKNDDVELGDIYDILDIPLNKVPIDYAEYRVYSKYLPLGLVLGYLVGLENLIKMLGIDHRLLEPGTKPTEDEYTIKFKNETHVFNRNDKIGTKIIGGLLPYEKAIKTLDIEDLNTKDAYFTLFGLKDISSVYVKELELCNELFVDPITEDILRSMNEPTTFVGLLIRAVELLDTYNYPDSQDFTQMRIRGYERIAGFIYSNLARSVKTFKNKNINGRSKIDLGPYDVWNSIIDDNSLKLVEDINPMQDLKERDIVTYVGEGGRSKESVNKGSRAYHKTDFGVMSEATVDSTDVAINTYLSANPAIEDLRGRVKKVEDTNTVNLLSTSANLAPFGVNDDKCFYI